MTEAACRYVTSCVSKELDETTVGVLEVTRRFMFSLGYQTSSVYLLSFDAQYEGLEHMEQYMTEEADVMETYARVSVSLGPDAVWEEYVASERAQREEFVTDARTASDRLQAMWDKVERQLHYRRVGYSLNLDGAMRRMIDYLAKLTDYESSGIAVELLTFDFEERKLLVRISNSSQENKGVCVYTEICWCRSGDLNKE